MSDHIRFARGDDAAAIAAIYEPFVRETWISFEEVPPDETEMRGRIEGAAGVFPFVCAESGGEVAGYAYASRHRDRSSYRWCVDTTVYVADGRRRSGLARKLYSAVLTLACEQGYHNAFAGIALPNDASVGFHRSAGFTDVGFTARRATSSARGTTRCGCSAS
jgi:phosphinothricin acetyltransferase